MRYTDKDLLDALRGFADEHDGRPPTAPEANAREGFPGVQTFIRRFGKWNTAIAEAGFDPRNRRRSDEELLADLREFAVETDEHPTESTVRASEELASPPTYARHFGSWSEALDAAGLATFDSSEVSE